MYGCIRSRPWCDLGKDKIPSSASIVLQFAIRLFLTDLSLLGAGRPSWCEVAVRPSAAKCREAVTFLVIAIAAHRS